MPRFGDARGYFTETFNADKMRQIGISEPHWVQDNQSYSAEQYTLRGMHFQLPPFAQAKIVRVLAGRIYDVAVDLRRGSPTYKKWLAVELNAEKMNQLYIPAGFAHGFLTLTRDVVMAYKVSAPYSKASDRSLSWADPAIGIQWPIDSSARPVLSDKDEKAPLLDTIEHELTDFS